MKKILYVIAAAFCLVACEKNTPGDGSTVNDDFVDLGLTSGTKWKTINELNPLDPENGFYTYEEAVVAFGENLPTKEQYMELINECTWTWTSTGYKVIGSNGKSITLRAAGYRNDEGRVLNVGSYGDYWSSAPDGLENAWDLYFNSSNVRMRNSNRRNARSVRLVR